MKKNSIVFFVVCLFFCIGVAFADDDEMQKYSRLSERVVTIGQPMIVTTDIATLNYINYLKSKQKFKNVEHLRDTVEETLGAKPIILPIDTKLYVSSVGVNYGVDSKYVIVSYFTKGLPYCVGLGDDLLKKAARVSNRVANKQPDMHYIEGDGKSRGGIPIGAFLPSGGSLSADSPTSDFRWNRPRGAGPGGTIW